MNSTTTEATADTPVESASAAETVPPLAPPPGASVWTRPWGGVTVERRKQAFVALIAIGAIAFPMIIGNDANIDSGANAANYAILALGLNIVVGFAGLLDLGYAAFFAIGAYTYGILSSFQVEPHWSSFWQPLAAVGLVQHLHLPTGDLVHFTLSFWIALPLGGDRGRVFRRAVRRADPAAARRLSRDRHPRLRRDRADRGAQLVLAHQRCRWPQWRAGTDAVRPQLRRQRDPYYYVAIAMVALLIFVSTRLRDSRIGRAWMAIREDEIAAGAMGVYLARYKLLAFATGAAFAGATGVFYIAKLQTATPEMFGYPVSIMILVMVVLGGIGSVWGVVLGAVVLQLLQSWWLEDLSGWIQSFGHMVGSPFLEKLDLTQSIELIFGIILVLMMLFRRGGLMPAYRHQAALSFDQQHAEVRRGSAVGIKGLGADPYTDGPVLEVRGVTVRFGGLVALNAIDLTVPQGSVVAVIGPNGSGKSTLFNAITGLTEAESGTILFRGHELLGLRPDQVLDAGVARTFQNIRLFPNLTVMENILIGQHARLRTGPLGAVLNLPQHETRGSGRTRVGDAGPRHLRQPAAAAADAGGGASLLRQPPPRRNRAGAGVAAENPAARRTDRRDEPGREPGARRTDQAASRPRPDRAADRAQARCGDQARRQGGGARSRREDRRGLARGGAQERGGAARLSRPECGPCLKCRCCNSRTSIPITAICTS